MTGLRCQAQGTDHRRMVEALADLPRFLLVAHRALQVPARHIEADRIPVDAVERLVDRDAAATAFQRGHQFDFVVVVLRQRRIGWSATVPGATFWIASVGFWKKNGGSRVGSDPISRAWAA